MIISFLMSLRPSAWNNAGFAEKYIMNFILLYFFKYVEKSQVLLKCKKIACTLHEDQYTCMSICRSVLRINNVSDTGCREDQNTFFIQ